MKQIIVLLFTASFIITGCSDSKKKFLPLTDSSGDPAKTQANNVGSGGGTTAVAASNVTQATPTCTTSPCNVGSTVTITVNFTQAVNVNGVPTLVLNNGKVATFVSGSGTTDLVFTYTVGAGDDVLALNYQDTSSLVLSNNSTVTLVSTGNNADTTLPPPTGAGSMPTTNTVVIDTSIPTISSVSALNQNGTYVKDGKVYITVTLSEAVIVNGVPTLALNTGNSTNGSATYISGSGTNILTFEYTVRPGDKVADLNYVSTTSLTGGTIKDAANNVATVTLPETTASTSLGGAKDIALDTTPKVASITTTTANGTYTVGSVINFTVTFTDVVTTSGPVTLTLANGATATCTNVTNSSTMNCSYTVQTGDTSADLTYQSTASLTGGTVTSAANPTLTAVRTLPEPTTFATSHDIVISAVPAVPTISFSGTSGNVAENGGNYSVTFNLSSASTQAITFTITSGNGTAIGGTDFTAVSQTITIPAGQTSYTLNIPITDDGVYEGNETFTLSMSGVSANATLAASTTQTVTITDNETAPTVSLTDSTTKTVAEDVGNYVFSVTLSGVSSVDTVVNVSTANGTAASGSDYTAVAGTITIPAGQTTGTINIPIINDDIFEGGAAGTKENFAVTISGPTVTGGATQTVSITDNETAPSISFTAGTTGSVAENINGGNYSVTFTLSGAASTDVTFTLASASGTAVSGTDFTAYNQTVTIPAGQTSVSVSIAITNDATVEGNENFTLTMSGASSNASLAAGTVQTVTILDDEIPTVSFTAGATNSVGEGAGNYTVNFTLSAAAAANVTFTLATANGTATSGSDYTAYNQTVTITAGQTTGTATIVISNDNVYEGNENFTLTMSGVSGNANLAAANVQTVTITDNEAVPTVSLSAATYSGAEGGAITISITRTGASDLATTVTLATAITGTGVTHAISGSDYTAFSGTINIPASAGNSTVTQDISTTADTTYENSETFNVALSSPSNATLSGTTSATVTITNDDTAPTASLTAGTTNSVGEGIGNYQFSVTLSAASGVDTVVTVNTAAGTATAGGTDFATLTNATITIPAGSTSGTINIAITDDTTYEGNETFAVTISGPTITGGATQTVTINDNDLGITSATTLDTDGNGKIDAYKIVFTSAITDSTFPGYAANANGSTQTAWLIAGYAGLVVSNGTAAASAAIAAGDGADAANDNTIYLRFTEGASTDTGAKPDLTTTATPGVTGTGGSLPQVGSLVANGGVTEQDGAKAVIMSAVGTEGSNSLVVTFSEAVYTNTGASGNITTGDTTFTNGNASGAGSVTALTEADGADKIITYTTNNNLVTGDTADTIAYAAGTVFDAANLQISTTAKTLTVNASTIPVVTLLEELDTDYDGKIDTVQLTFDKDMADSTISGNLSQLTVGGLAVTGFNTGTTANDTIVKLTVSTSIATGTDFKTAIYTAGSWQSFTGGNLASFNFTGHNTSSTGASTIPKDAAAPVITDATATDATNDYITITFSEDIDSTIRTAIQNTPSSVANYFNLKNGNGTTVTMPTVNAISWTSNKVLRITFTGDVSATLTDSSTVTLNSTTQIKDAANNFYASSAVMNGSFTTDTIHPYITLVIDTTPATGATNNTILVKFSEAVNSTAATTLANYSSLVKVSDSSSVNLTGAVVTQVSSDTYKITLNTGVTLTSGSEYKLTATTSITDLAGLALTDPKNGTFIAQDALRVLAAKMTSTTTVQVIFSRLVDTSGSATCATPATCAVKYHFSPTLGSINSATVSDNIVTLTLDGSVTPKGIAYTVVGANGTTGDDPIDASSTFDAVSGDAIKDSNGSGAAGAKTLSSNPQDRVSFTGLGTTINTFAEGWYMSDPFADGSVFSFTFGYKSKAYVGPNLYNNTTLRFDADGKNIISNTYGFTAANSVSLSECDGSTVAKTTSGFGYGYGSTSPTPTCISSTTNYYGPIQERGLVGYTSLTLSGNEFLTVGPIKDNVTDGYFTTDISNRLNLKPYATPSHSGGGNIKSIQTFYAARDTANSKDYMFVGFSCGLPTQCPVIVKIPLTFTSGAIDTIASGNGSGYIDLNIAQKGANLILSDSVTNKVAVGGNPGDAMGIDSMYVDEANGKMYVGNSGGLIQNSTFLTATAGNGIAASTIVSPPASDYSPLMLPGVKSGGSYSEGLLKVSPGQKGMPFIKKHNGKMYVVRNLSMNPIATTPSGLEITSNNKTPNIGELWVCTPGADNICSSGEWTLLLKSGTGSTFATTASEGEAAKTISMFEITPEGVVYLGFDGTEAADRSGNVGFRVFRTTAAGADIPSTGWALQGVAGLDSGATGSKYTHIQSSAVVKEKDSTYYLYITTGRYNTTDLWYMPIKVFRQADVGTDVIVGYILDLKHKIENSNLMAFISKTRKNVPMGLLFGIVLVSIVGLGLRRKYLKDHHLI